MATEQRTGPDRAGASPLARTAHRLSVRLLAAATGALGSIALAQIAVALWPGSPIAIEWRRSIPFLAPFVALLVLVAGLAATTLLTSARLRATLPAAPAKPRQRRRRWLTRTPLSVSAAAHRPQAIMVTPVVLAATFLGLTVSPHQATPLDSGTAWRLGLGLLALSFPFLIVERTLAHRGAACLPEARGLRAVALNVVLAFAASGIGEFMASQLWPYAELPARLSLLLSVGIGLELALRALGRLFLPPPEPSEAVAAIRSTLALIVIEGSTRGNLAAPIREQLGLDFSRSWALTYVRSAALPVLAVLLIVAWALSGLAIVTIDERGIYERFGAPVAVLQPGAHLLLPWPMGKLRRWENGRIHELSLADLSSPVIPRTGADDSAPPSADRLWEQAHPDEISVLIASTGSSTGSGADTAPARQNFQIVSADIRILYQFRGDDASVLAGAYGLSDPDSLIRGIAGRALAAYLGGLTLDRVLGADRSVMAATLKETIQAELDRIGTGVAIVEIVIQAMHPPAGAAAAYHGVQAAQIAAETRISAERGMALAALSGSRQYANMIVTQAEGVGAEMRGAADEDATRFAAERSGAALGGPAFRFERRLATLGASLGKASLTILDHRLPAGGGAALDLRAPTAGTPGRDTGVE